MACESWRWRSSITARAPSGRLTSRAATQGLDLSLGWQADAGNRWRLSATAVGTPDDVESTLQRHDSGVDELHSRTRREPRLSLQWLHRL